MALPFLQHGSLARSAGLYDAIGKQVRLLNLKPAKRIEFKFDPFTDNVNVIRSVLNYFHQETVRNTNPKCVLKTTIVNDRSEPTLLVKLVDDKKILFKANNLQGLEILMKFNELVSSKAKADEPVQGTQLKLTKSQKR